MADTDIQSAMKEAKKENKPHILKYVFFLVLFIVAAIVVSYMYMENPSSSVDLKEMPPSLPDGTNSVETNAMPAAPSNLITTGSSGNDSLPPFPGFP